MKKEIDNVKSKTSGATEASHTTKKHLQVNDTKGTERMQDRAIEVLHLRSDKHKQISQENPSVRDTQEDGLAQDKISFSVVTKDQGILTKIISLVDGELIKNASECQLSLGTIQKHTCTIERFANDLRKLSSRQALVHGVSVYTEAIICSSAKFESVKKNNGDSPVLTRTKDDLSYPDGAGLMMFDHDKSKSNAVALHNKAIETLSPAKLIEIISSILPEITASAWVSTPSTSSCIYSSDGKELRGEGDGFHLYLFPKNAKDIERFMDVLGIRLILAGYGRIEFSKTGSMLIRTIIDLSVGSPERLDFVAGAVCHNGLSQRLPDPHLHKGELLDTFLLPDLTAKKQLEHDEIIRELKSKAESEQKKIQALYADETVKELIASGMDAEIAKTKVTARLNNVLDDEVMLYLENGKNITVGELLNDGSKYDGVCLADPLEPEYGGWSRSIARFYWNNGSSLIHSFAHGPTNYFFLYGKYPRETILRFYEMNKKYASCLIGGKFKVIKESYDRSANRHRIDLLGVVDFKNYFSNDKVAVDSDDPDKISSIADGWLNWKGRRSYENVVFDPTETAQRDSYNLFRGLPIKPVPGDWSLMQRHIHDVICGGDADLYEYVNQWMANIVQNPGGPRPGVALVIKGGKGVGKGVYVNTFGKIFGEAYLSIATSKGFLGNFNAHLVKCIVVFLDEAVWDGDKAAEGQLKALITEPAMMFEPKGVDAMSLKNHLNVIMASNEDWVCPASVDERRFVVLSPSTQFQGNTSYFNDLCCQMDNGGVAAMYYDLLQVRVDIDFLRKPPVTKGLKDQILQGLNPTLLFWHDVLSRGYLLSLDGTDWPEEVMKHEVYEEFRVSSHYPRRESISAQTFWQNTWKFLGGTVVAKRVLKGTKRQAMINLESCEVMRDKFTKYTKVTFDD